MLATEDMNLITSLKPDEQVVIISLAKSLVKNRQARTKAQEMFANMREKYKDYDMSMDEIDDIIHSED